MRTLLVFPVLFLAGCVNPYVPEPIEVTDAARYAADVGICQAAAAAYIPKASMGDVAQATVSGASGTISYAPINPLIPALGAVGGAANSAAIGFDVTGQVKKNVARHCLIDKLAIDHAAIIARPEN